MVTQASVRPLLGTAALDECLPIRRPRILQVGKFWAPHYGGIETHLRELCHGLMSVVDVDVLVSNESRSYIEERDCDIRVTRMPRFAQVASAPLCPSMLPFLRESSADLVHLHLPNPPAVIACLLSGYRGKLVVSVLSDIVRQKWMAKVLKPTVAALLRRADAVISLSPNHVAHSPLLQPFRDKCHVIPHGVAFQSFDLVDREQVAQIRARYGKPIVLAVGRLVYYKGFEFLIRAMRDIDAHLLLIGDGPLREQLIDTASHSGAQDKVSFLGNVDDLRPYYHACNVFVLPSIARSEAFGIVQLEAMACSKPVINTQLESGVPWVSLNGQTGITVHPGDTQALVEAISTLLSQPMLAARYGRAGRKRVEQEFATETMVARTLQLYSQVLGIS
ncbi:MAG TPA: glycosyltransferase [Terriglobales bacterium]|nr:glycosyltransferase [Terriglobales bacterium]